MRRAALLLSAAVAVILVLAVLPAAAASDGTQPFGEELVKKVQELMKSDLVSPQTKTCLTCHIVYTPDIVYEWAMSKHAMYPASKAGMIYDMIGAPEWKGRIAGKFKDYKYVVGCYECHGMFKEQDRPDVIENHNGFKIVTVVTKKDCSQCHPKESAELSWTWHAMGTLHATFLPWYKAIMAWAKEQGANPFGDAKARELYEKYFPPYLTKKRDVDDVNWDFYKEIAKAIFEYLTTGKENDIVKMLKQRTGMVTPYDMDFKNWIAPLWPASGVLNTTVVPKLGIKITINAVGAFKNTVGNVMSHYAYRNGYIYHACFQCHGSIVLPYKKETVEIEGVKVNRVALWGWPSMGAARVDPDGSIGICTACHARHLFSVKQARDPQVCGQCHLGYDHPHIEVFEESKHGNIWHTYGESWNWERLPWRVGVDFNAPTCAACHMSTLSVVGADGKERIVVKGTHDFVQRIVWDAMHFFAIPKGVVPDKVQQAFFLGGWSQLKGTLEKAVEIYKKTGRAPVFMGIEFVEDGGKPGETKFPRLIGVKFTGDLAKHREEMKKVCRLCHSSQWVDNYFRSADQNMIDYDIVARFAFSLLQLAWKEGIHDKSNLNDEYMEIMWYYIWHHDGRRWRAGAFMMGPDFAHWYGIVDTVMDKLGRMISYLETALKVKALEEQLAAIKKMSAGGEVPPAVAAKLAEISEELSKLKVKLAAMEAEVPVLRQKISSFEAGLSKAESEIGDVKASVDELVKRIEDLSKKLEAMLPPEQAKKLQEDVQSLKAAVEELKSASKQAEAKVSELDKKIGGVSSTAYAIGGVAIVLALVALGVALARRR